MLPPVPAVTRFVAVTLPLALKFIALTLSNPLRLGAGLETPDGPILPTTKTLPATTLPVVLNPLSELNGCCDIYIFLLIYHESKFYSIKAGPAILSRHWYE